MASPVELLMDSDIRRSANTFGTTVDYLLDPRYIARMHVIEVPPIPKPGTYNLSDEARLFFRVIRAALKERVLLLYSSRGYFKPELLAAAAIGCWPRRFRPTVVFYGDMYEPSKSLRNKVERFILKVADRAIQRYVLMSEADCVVFQATWDIDPHKVRTCPVFLRHPHTEPSGKPVTEGDYIFAGGESLRDFEPLLAAAACLPEYKFVISSSQLKNRTDLPRNVTVTAARFADFINLMQSARVVVVPLQKNTRRSAGAITYLSAMWLKKPLIVTDALGVREYVEDRKTGLVVDGSPDSYVRALSWLFDPTNALAVECLREEAHHVVSAQYLLEHHVTRLLDLIDEVTAEGELGRAS
jgi:glycosyltransferase involved in cell wall biosynthesis